ncbi:MAG: PAS domain S-box protein [Pseudomonadota bacterium]
MGVNGAARVMIINAYEKAMDKIAEYWKTEIEPVIGGSFEESTGLKPLFYDLWHFPPESTHNFLRELTRDVQQWPKISEAVVAISTNILIPQILEECRDRTDPAKCMELFHHSLSQTVAEITRASILELNTTLRQFQEEHQSTVEEIRSMNEELRTANEEIRASLDEVRQFKDRLELMTNQASDAILVVDASSYQITEANRKAEEIFGWSRSDMIGSSLVRLCPASHLRLLFERLDKLGRGGQIRFDDVPFISRDEREFPVSASIARVQTDEESVYFMILRDILARKQTEEALVRAKEDWENTFDAITDLVMLLDNEHTIVRVNKAAAEALAATKEDLIGRKCYEIIHETSRPIKQCPLTVTINKMKPHTREITIPMIGGTFICATAPMIDREGKTVGFTHTLKDITKSKQLELSFHQAMRMESIATLAGGIAHDFNNLLMGIQGYTSLMMNSLPPTHNHYDMLKRIEASVTSGAELTKQLLGFARKGKYDVKPVSLNEIIRKSLAIFGRARKEIIIGEKYREDLWAIEGDQGQIEQVLLNLYVNAWQAMPAGGELHLETDNLVVTEDVISPLNLDSGKYVRVSVADTGIGMDEKTQQRIFDPFFTTKEMGRGTGLGLASAYGIIKNHGGIITVKSRVGYGTVFTIYLPASDKEITPDIPPGKAEMEKGSETILLIDDQQIVLEVGKELLDALGYNAILARSGHEAVEVYKQRINEIDLVIIDMIMPGMDGGETYDVLKRLNPGIKTILSTGYSIDGDAAEIMKQGVNAFIQKPFSMKDLANKIREVLDK